MSSMVSLARDNIQFETVKPIQPQVPAAEEEKKDESKPQLRLFCLNEEEENAPEAVKLFSRWISEKWVSGERLLLAAILHRAVLDAVLNSNSTEVGRRRIGEEANRWMHSDDNSYFTSFLNICEVLDLDPGWVRKKVHQMTPESMKNQKIHISLSQNSDDATNPQA